MDAKATKTGTHHARTGAGERKRQTDRHRDRQSDRQTELELENYEPLHIPTRQVIVTCLFVTCNSLSLSPVPEYVSN